MTALSAPARADDAANTATARALGTEGVTLADSGRCSEALEKLERAERLHHAPTTATRLGECEIEVGKLVVGTERLQRVIREPLPPSAHPAFAAAVQRAQRALEKALPRIATLRVSVKVPAGVKFVVRVDDEPVPDAMLDSDRRIDPGPHRVSAEASGYLTSTARVSLEEGETSSTSLELLPDPNAVREPGDGSGPSNASPTPPPASGSKALPIIALGLGAAALGTGALAGFMVARKSSALNSTCDANRVCPAASQSDLRDAKTWATVSTVAFVAGGTCVVAGLVALFASGTTQRPSSAALRVRPSIGPASVGVDGVF